jgi:hypothetical protein
MPTCGKLLTTESRRRHDKNLTPAESAYRQDSESDEEFSMTKLHRQNTRTHHISSSTSPLVLHRSQSFQGCLLSETASQLEDDTSILPQAEGMDYDSQAHSEEEKTPNRGGGGHFEMPCHSTYSESSSESQISNGK